MGLKTLYLKENTIMHGHKLIKIFKNIHNVMNVILKFLKLILNPLLQKENFLHRHIEKICLLTIDKQLLKFHKNILVLIYGCNKEK